MTKRSLVFARFVLQIWLHVGSFSLGVEFNYQSIYSCRLEPQRPQIPEPGGGGGGGADLLVNRSVGGPNCDNGI